jgi:hypothetical protein
MCAFEGKATTHSQFSASDKFCVALRERIYLGCRQIIEIRCVAPLFVLAVGNSVDALMPTRMVRPPLVFAGVGDACFSLFRTTGEFMFAGGRHLRFRGRRPLHFGLRRPVNVGDSVATESGSKADASGTGSKLWSGAPFAPTCGQRGCAPAPPIMASGGTVESRLGALGLFAIAIRYDAAGTTCTIWKPLSLSCLRSPGSAATVPRWMRPPSSPTPSTPLPCH